MLASVSAGARPRVEAAFAQGRSALPTGLRRGGARVAFAFQWRTLLTFCSFLPLYSKAGEELYGIMDANMKKSGAA